MFLTSIVGTNSGGLNISRMRLFKTKEEAVKYLKAIDGPIIKPVAGGKGRIYELSNNKPPILHKVK